MGKKGKGQEPNAPELQQILLDSSSVRQPPHNPYYPSLTDSIPPPAYSDLSAAANSVPMSRLNANIPPGPNYERLSNNAPRPQAHLPPTVIVHHQPAVHHDRRAEKYHRKVRKYNNELFLVALIAIGLSLWAVDLYRGRNCLNYVVHQPTKDVEIKVEDVREMHFTVIYISFFLLLLSLIKCGTGQSRSYGCYIFVIGLTTFVGTMVTGYLAYLTFYSPCSLKPGELATNAFRTIVASFDKIPSPDKGVFNESNVFQLAQEDKNGVMIFFIDLFNFAAYLSAFISATMLC